MVEVIWHARGGQGAFTAARCLGAAAALSAGMHALAFPTFGPERRGAPMRAFTKMSDAPIGDRSASRTADVVVYLDETLLEDGWEAELAEGGVLLLNSAQPSFDSRIICLDGDAISSEVLGRAIPNTAFLGAIAAVSDAVSLEDIHEGIKATMPERLQEKNIRIANAAYEAMLQQGACAHEERMRTYDKDLVSAHAISMRTPPRETRSFTPYLRNSFTVAPNEFARSTCFTGGHLVTENAGWRSVRPVLDQARCTLCLNCYQFCPDGTIYKVRDASGDVEQLDIDYAFCKGCGVCAKVCPADCIQMIPEAEEACA